MRLSLMMAMLAVGVAARADFVMHSGSPLVMDARGIDAPVVHSALTMFADDYSRVFGAPVVNSGTLDIRVAVDADNPDIKGRTQAFVIEVGDDNVLRVTGSDPHGAAYGIMQLSRMIGVSPWEWWADVTPRPRQSLTLPAGYKDVQSPDVEYRGIFINDEDWGLMPWSYNNYEPRMAAANGEDTSRPDVATKGAVGPYTNERIFQLMLRLRANYYWPAMHECTYPFFLTPGNREMARRYGIYIGGSHCEPMASSAAVEWGLRGQGDYDYVNNADNVYRFWEERIRDVADQPIVYTIGMRGVHDGAMKGAKTVDEQRDVLTRVFADQRQLLSAYVDSDVTRVPQVFIPYKEVLDVYNAGLDVPEDVCLMWCDDNYGYIKHFPTEAERARQGGNGIYYHVSYWGRPHDYLWLGTFSPYLLHQQMRTAYDNGIQRMWILNVGDIKPAEYQTELFMDMAWDIDAVDAMGVDKYLQTLVERDFEPSVAPQILWAMNESYNLAFVHKPEYMGNTRTEEKDPAWRVIRDLPWTDAQIDTRLARYTAISDTVEAIAAEIPADRQAAYYELVKYPVQAAAQMNVKMLTAQQARHGHGDFGRSVEAYDSIVAMTDAYNSMLDGKWRGMMSHHPRNLGVFEPVDTMLSVIPNTGKGNDAIHILATDLVGEGLVPCPHLGYEGSAVVLPANRAVELSLPPIAGDSVMVTLALLPTHPLNGVSQRIAISTDGSAPTVVDITTHGRSEEWKENVLWNRTTRSVRIPAADRIVIEALDPGLILDEVLTTNY